jgi:hypothetical protein
VALSFVAAASSGLLGLEVFGAALLGAVFAFADSVFAALFVAVPVAAAEFVFAF